jgi:hypothetical protein
MCHHTQGSKIVFHIAQGTFPTALKGELSFTDEGFWKIWELA